MGPRVAARASLYVINIPEKVFPEIPKPLNLWCLGLNLTFRLQRFEHVESRFFKLIHPKIDKVILT